MTTDTKQSSQRVLYYLGPYIDNTFLDTLYDYDKYLLYDNQPNSYYYKHSRDEYIKLLVNSYGLPTKIISKDVIEFGKITYYMNYDCEKKFEIKGDLYISGYYPEWFSSKSYNFYSKVYVGCTTVISSPLNTPFQVIKGNYCMEVRCPHCNEDYISSSSDEDYISSSSDEDSDEDYISSSESDEDS